MTNKNTRKLRTLNFQRQERIIDNTICELTKAGQHYSYTLLNEKVLERKTLMKTFEQLTEGVYDCCLIFYAFIFLN